MHRFLEKLMYLSKAYDSCNTLYIYSICKYYLVQKTLFIFRKTCWRLIWFMLNYFAGVACDTQIFFRQLCNFFDGLEIGRKWTSFYAKKYLSVRKPTFSFLNRIKFDLRKFYVLNLMVSKSQEEIVESSIPPKKKPNEIFSIWEFFFPLKTTGRKKKSSVGEFASFFVRR